MLIAATIDVWRRVAGASWDRTSQPRLTLTEVPAVRLSTRKYMLQKEVPFFIKILHLSSPDQACRSWDARVILQNQQRIAAQVHSQGISLCACTGQSVTASSVSRLANSWKFNKWQWAGSGTPQGLSFTPCRVPASCGYQTAPELMMAQSPQLVPNLVWAQNSIGKSGCWESQHAPLGVSCVCQPYWKEAPNDCSTEEKKGKHPKHPLRTVGRPIFL